MSNSCFVERLEHYLPLTELEREALATLESEPRDLAAGQILISEGDKTDALYIVQRGLLHTSSMLKGGDRQILKLHHPGDMIGSSGIAWKDAPSTAMAVAPSVVCRFPRMSLTTIFIEHPRLAALFYVLGMQECGLLADRLKSLGRTDGKTRIATLLLDKMGRMRVTNPRLGNTLELRMTQADIGDAVGMTQIHVNRLLRELTEEGYIARDGKKLTILSEFRLAELCDYVDRYDEIDTSWFPPPTVR
jgi:CRP/FNR family transcriptional regulator